MRTPTNVGQTEQLKSQEALIEATNQLSAKAMEAYSQLKEMGQEDPDYAIKCMKNLMRLMYRAEVLRKFVLSAKDVESVRKIQKWLATERKLTTQESSTAELDVIEDIIKDYVK